MIDAIRFAETTEMIAKKRHVRIQGLVTPEEWAKQSRVVSVAIVTDDFEKYVVFDSRIGHGLLEHLDKRVEVSGRVIGEDVIGNRLLEVSDYRII